VEWDDMEDKGLIFSKKCILSISRPNIGLLKAEKLKESLKMANF
jgi:hypothetical protein